MVTSRVTSDVLWHPQDVVRRNPCRTKTSAPRANTPSHAAADVNAGQLDRFMTVSCVKRHWDTGASKQSSDLGRVLEHTPIATGLDNVDPHADTRR